MNQIVEVIHYMVSIVKKYKLEQIIKNCYEVAGDSIKLLIETSDIRKLNDEDYNSFKGILIIVSDKLQ